MAIGQRKIKCDLENIMVDDIELNYTAEIFLESKIKLNG